MTRTSLVPPLILVTVGTDFHPFDRLVMWVDEWVEQADIPVRCLVQHGSSRPPRAAEGRSFLDHPELQAAMAAAAVVVSHGGPGSLTEARAHGHLPICVPRDPALGEHVDRHQQRFARHLATAGLAVLAETRADLESALHQAILETGERRRSEVRPDLRAPENHLPAVRRVAELLAPLTTRKPIRTEYSA